MEEFRGGKGVGEGQLLVLYVWEANVALRMFSDAVDEYVYDDYHILQ